MGVYDFVVVGGGPGGYPAAVRLGDSGFRVALIEEHLLGGECTNYGCVPTKALLRAARLAEDIARYSWARGSVDLEDVFEWAKGVASDVRNGIDRLLKGNNVDIVRGRAVGIRGKCIVVEGMGEICASRSVLIALGSEPATLPGIEPDGRIVHDNRSLLRSRPPESIVIVGAGYVGVEFAFALASLGVDVALVEIMDRPLPAMEREVGLFVSKILRDRGVRLYLKSRILRVNRSGESLTVTVASQSGHTVTVEPKALLLAVGRRPRRLLDGLEAIGVEVDNRGFVRKDCTMRTRSEYIYAAGDIAGPPLLAHKAIVESLVAAENMMGREWCLSNPVYPEVVYIRPEIARVTSRPPPGASLVQTRIRVEGLARSRIEGEGGFVSIIYDERNHKIYGVTAIYEGAAEAAGLLSHVVSSGLRLEDLRETVIPHPTLSEALSEAVHFSLGEKVHVLGGVRRRIRI